MQHEVVSPGNLLTSSGNLREPGWSRQLLQTYNKKNIRTSRLRIKEWDYYAVLNEKFGLGLTIADNGYMGFISVTLFDFILKNEITRSIITPFPMGKFNMPVTSEQGNVRYCDKKMTLFFSNNSQHRILTVKIPDFKKGKNLRGSIILHKNPGHETMVIATPFQKPGHFYYNQKINNMPVEGYVDFDGRRFDFGKEKSFAVLDWGRGVWTYNNTWYWGSASGKLNGKLFGFNIGYGFGDTSAATENMLFYNGKVHKLDEVKFFIPNNDLMKPWTFSSSDNRFIMTFKPILDRASKSKILLLESDQHQVFGYFSGTAILDDNKKLILNDFFGFAEKVMNKW